MQTPGAGHLYTVNTHMAKNTNFAGPQLRHGTMPNAPTQMARTGPSEHY